MRNDGIQLKAIASAILITGLFLSPPPLVGQQTGPWRVCPLPTIEAEGVLSQWLVHSGFEVLRSFLEAGTIRLLGVKGNESWEILIRPQSPLASSIQIRYGAEGRPDPSKLEILWTFLKDYSRGPVGEEIKSNEEVPDRVLSMRESVACIKAKGGSEPVQFSGFIVDERGFLLSTAHDLNRIEEIRVTLSSGQEWKGHLIKIDSNRDLALIDIRLNREVFVSLERRRDLLGRGEKIYAIGCPGDQSGVIQGGHLSGPLQQMNGLPLWQVEMEILPGSSGSPVFDADGSLVGVVKGRYRGTERVGFVIPVETVMEFLKGQERK